MKQKNKEFLQKWLLYSFGAIAFTFLTVTMLLMPVFSIVFFVEGRYIAGAITGVVFFSIVGLIFTIEH